MFARAKLASKFGKLVKKKAYYLFPRLAEKLKSLVRAEINNEIYKIK